MAGPLTIACPVCHEVFALPSELVDVDTDANRVVIAVDRSAVYGHLTACATKAAEVAGKELAKVEATVPAAELAGRIERMLAMRAYVAAGGSRACTMCGVTAVDCLEQVGKITPTAGHPVSPACCGACRDGNTHPAPGEGKGMCAEWSAAREASS